MSPFESSCAPYDERMGKKRKPESEASELVRAATELMDAMKGAGPDAIEVAKEAYEAVLARYSAGTEAMRKLLADQDVPTRT